MFIPLLFLLSLSLSTVYCDGISHSGNVNFSSSHERIHFFEHLAARCKRQIAQSSACLLTPQATEGPYYWNATIRQNITYVSPAVDIRTLIMARSFSEGKAGIPLRLSIFVLDTNNCTPLANALVDLWHCDAIGIYSHYMAASQGINGGANDNETFFRGRCAFSTVRRHASR